MKNRPGVGRGRSAGVVNDSPGLERRTSRLRMAEGHPDHPEPGSERGVRECRHRAVANTVVDEREEDVRAGAVPRHREARRRPEHVICLPVPFILEDGHVYSIPTSRVCSGLADSWYLPPEESRNQEQCDEADCCQNQQEPRVPSFIRRSLDLQLLLAKELERLRLIIGAQSIDLMKVQ